MTETHMYDIIIVGAGAAGVGMGILLEKCGVKNYLILERSQIGASFASWPSYTRFISPSFCGNFFNAVDLNAVSPDTSPAFTLETEHPSGEDYAEYLQLTAKHHDLSIHEGVTVTQIEKKDNIFHIHTDAKTYQTTFVIRAGGEFQHPDERPFEGGELCIHSSKIDQFPDDHYTVIGGYESGLELAAHLLSIGKSVTVIDEGDPLEVEVSDSSIAVAPATRDRLDPYLDTGRFEMRTDATVTQVAMSGDQYEITIDGNTPNIISLNPPILATGFHTLPSFVEEHFARHENGNVLLDEHDQSTQTSGMFLVGPGVRQQNVIFCFIYKFRQRFPIVAEYILNQLGHDTVAINEYKNANMYLKDLECCEDECVC